MEDSSRPHWGMVIDLAKCVGCDSCTVACKAENRTPPGITYNVVLERETGAYPNVRLEALPRPCMQCENPPCVAVCPQKARSLPAPVLQMLSQKLAPFMEKRQENELYL